MIGHLESMQHNCLNTSSQLCNVRLSFSSSSWPSSRQAIHSNVGLVTPTSRPIIVLATAPIPTSSWVFFLLKCKWLLLGVSSQRRSVRDYAHRELHECGQFELIVEVMQIFYCRVAGTRSLVALAASVLICGVQMFALVKAMWVTIWLQSSRCS